MKYIKWAVVFSVLLTTTACQSTGLKQLEGEWIAQPESQSVMIVGQENGENLTVGGENPYYLTFNKNGNYTLKLDDENTETGTYTIDEDNNVTLTTDNGVVADTCELKNGKQLLCNSYASLYTKEE